MKIYANIFNLPLREPFSISRTVFYEAKTIVVVVEASGFIGHGQCIPQSRFDEDLEVVMAQINNVASAFSNDNLSRELLQEALSPGAARNGIDCALWDLEAKMKKTPAWRLAGLTAAPRPVTTAYTLSLGSLEDTKKAASLHADRPLLKIKLGKSDDSLRLRAVRQGAPEARIIVDANEAWDIDTLDALAPVLESVAVEMVEQPLPVGQDCALKDRNYPFFLCADESCRGRSSLPHLIGKYDIVNIKLDKVGGFTEALATSREAERIGLKTMVGCGVGSSLAISPAVLVAQNAVIADLDGPLFLSEDCEHGLKYSESLVWPPSSALWG